MKKKLLVIEDENSVAKQLRWGLDSDYEITIASNAENENAIKAVALCAADFCAKPID